MNKHPSDRYSLAILIHDLTRHQLEEGGPGGLLCLIRALKEKPLSFQKSAIALLKELGLFFKYDSEEIEDSTFFLNDYYLYGSDEIAAHIIETYFDILDLEDILEMTLSIVYKPSHKILNRLQSALKHGKPEAISDNNIILTTTTIDEEIEIQDEWEKRVAKEKGKRESES